MVPEYGVVGDGRWAHKAKLGCTAPPGKVKPSQSDQYRVPEELIRYLLDAQPELVPPLHIRRPDEGQPPIEGQLGAARALGARPRGEGRRSANPGSGSTRDEEGRMVTRSRMRSPPSPGPLVWHRKKQVAEEMDPEGRGGPRDDPSNQASGIIIEKPESNGMRDSPEDCHMVTGAAATVTAKEIETLPGAEEPTSGSQLLEQWSQEPRAWSASEPDPKEVRPQKGEGQTEGMEGDEEKGPDHDQVQDGSGPDRMIHYVQGMRLSVSEIRFEGLSDLGQEEIK